MKSFGVFTVFLFLVSLLLVCSCWSAPGSEEKIASKVTSADSVGGAPEKDKISLTPKELELLAGLEDQLAPRTPYALDGLSFAYLIETLHDESKPIASRMAAASVLGVTDIIIHSEIVKSLDKEQRKQRDEQICDALFKVFYAGHGDNRFQSTDQLLLESGMAIGLRCLGDRRYHEVREYFDRLKIDAPAVRAHYIERYVALQEIEKKRKAPKGMDRLLRFVCPASIIIIDSYSSRYQKGIFIRYSIDTFLGVLNNHRESMSLRIVAAEMLGLAGIYGEASVTQAIPRIGKNMERHLKSNSSSLKLEVALALYRLKMANSASIAILKQNIENGDFRLLYRLEKQRYTKLNGKYGFSSSGLFDLEEGRKILEFGMSVENEKVNTVATSCLAEMADILEKETVAKIHETSLACIRQCKRLSNKRIALSTLVTLALRDAANKGLYVGELVSFVKDIKQPESLRCSSVIKLKALGVILGELDIDCSDF